MIVDSLNRPLRSLRVSVIDACNLRCGYCMPEDKFPKGHKFLSKQQRLNFSEITRLVKIFAGLGVSMIRITGGEPLLEKSIAQLISQIRAIEGIKDIALTTNGVFLPQYAKALKQAGLDRLNVSIDSLDPQIFDQMSGRKGYLEKALKGIKTATDVGFYPIKINVVLQKGINDRSILELIEYFKTLGHTVRFIEYMDVGNSNDWNLEQVMPSKKILQEIEKKHSVKAIAKNFYGEVADTYQYQDKSAKIGFISSVTQPFCASCIRARLSADGKFYTCLFASKATDLRKLLKEKASDTEIREHIAKVWQNRADRYSEERAELTEDQRKRNKVEMYQVGG